MKTIEELADEYMNYAVINIDRTANYEEDDYNAGYIHGVADSTKDAFIAGYNEATQWKQNNTIHKKVYRALIDQNIEELDKYMPEHSLEKKHIINIIEWSYKMFYDDDFIHIKNTPK